jgi:hypothetical protein
MVYLNNFDNKCLNKYEKILKIKNLEIFYFIYRLMVIQISLLFDNSLKTNKIICNL